MVAISDLLSKPDLSASDLNKMKLVDLKKICKEKGLSVAGTKNELISRFLQSLNPNADSTVCDVPDGAKDLLSSPQSQNQDGSSLSVEATEGNMVGTDHGIDSKNEENEIGEPPEKKQKFAKIEAPPSTASLEQKKLADRMKRFGAVNEEQKKMARAERFQTGTTTAASEDDILKKRAERFNLKTESSTDSSSDAVLKKRAARFGEAKEQEAPDASSLFAKRQARFGQATAEPSDDAKLKRAQRFGIK